MFGTYNVVLKKNDKVLIYNTLSKAVIVTDDDCLEKLKSSNVEKYFSSEEINELKQMVVLIDNKRTENAITKFFLSKSRIGSPNLYLTLYLTYNCNLKCTYCYQNQMSKLNTGNMTFLIMKDCINWIKMLVDSAQYKNIYVTFYGGEPLCNIDVLKSFVTHFNEISKKHNILFTYYIITNGTLIDNNTANYFKLINLKQAQITLDGTVNVHNKTRIYNDGSGSFDDVSNGIKNLLLNGIKCSIRVNIDNSNINDVKGLINYISKYLLPIAKKNNSTISVSLGNILDLEIGDKACDIDFEMRKNKLYKKVLEHDLNIIDIFDRIACPGISSNSFHIEPNGDIYSCSQFVGIENLRISDVKSNQFNSSYYMLSTLDVGVSECISCTYYPVCMGGCRANFLDDKNYMESFENKIQCNKHLIDETAKSILPLIYF